MKMLSTRAPLPKRSMCRQKLLEDYEMGRSIFFRFMMYINELLAPGTLIIV